MSTQVVGFADQISDQATPIAHLKEKAAQLVRDRDWEQFHSPQNLSMSIAAEAAELMEKFLWMDAAASRKAVDINRQDIEDELADVVIAALMFANAAKIDISRAVLAKMVEIEAKYPVSKSKGCSLKYTEL